MIPLPVPIKGELFFGTLCRFHERTEKPAYTSFGKVVLGSGTANPGTTIPLHLDWIGQRLPPGYPVDASGIVQHHSLEPFILGLVSWAKKRKYTIDTHLKSCPECRQHDTSTLGEPIWRTIHQVEGIHYCLHHSCPLETSEKPSVFQKGSRSYRPEYFSPKDTTFIPIENIGNLEIHSRFLGMIQDILDGKNVPWKVGLNSLWGEMERQGFTNGVHVDGWKVLEKGKEMFGPEMESLFGLTQTERGRRLITNVLTEEDPSPHRILFFHLLLDLPVWKEAAPAKLEPKDYREKRNARDRVPKEKHQSRLAFLKLIVRSLPSDFKDRPLYKKLQAEDEKWLASLQRLREAKRQKTEARLLEEDPVAARLVGEIATTLKNKEGCPNWIRKNIIIKSAGENGRLIQRCSQSPLTKKALEDAIETQEEIIQRRIEWAKIHAPTALAEYEFRAFARVRGLRTPPKIPGVLNRQAKKELREEQLQTMKQSLDPEGAAIVETTVKRMVTTKDRPVWVTLTGIIRAAGKEGEIVEACRNEPLTHAAVTSATDTAKTIREKRLTWAKEYYPAILRMAPYAQKDALGLREGRKSKKTFPK